MQDETVPRRVVREGVVHGRRVEIYDDGKVWIEGGPLGKTDEAIELLQFVLKDTLPPPPVVELPTAFREAAQRFGERLEAVRGAALGAFRAFPELPQIYLSAIELPRPEIPPELLAQLQGLEGRRDRAARRACGAGVRPAPGKRRRRKRERKARKNGRNQRSR